MQVPWVRKSFVVKRPPRVPKYRTSLIDSVSIPRKPYMTLWFYKLLISVLHYQHFSIHPLHFLAADLRLECDYLMAKSVNSEIWVSTTDSSDFICRENPRRSGILLFPGRPRFCRLMKTRNLRYPRSSGMHGDKSGESGAFLFSRRVPDFCDGRRSFPTNEFVPSGTSASVGDGFRSHQSPKLLGSSPPITNK